MRLAIVTAFPPSKVTLSEYGYYLVKHFRLQKEVTEIILITDITKEKKDVNFKEEGCKITVKECWSFNDSLNILRITKVVTDSKPDALLFNLQFLKFGDKKIPAALGLLLPFICRLKGIPTISLLHNNIEQVDFSNAGFTLNKKLIKVNNLIGNTLTKLVLASDVLAVTMSQYKNSLEKKYGAKNVALIPHGTFETPTEPDYTLKQGPKQIMAFGKFGTYKRVEVLIEAVELIRKQTNDNLEIVIAGTDSPNTPGYLQAIKEKYVHVKQLRFTGYVTEENVSLIFKDSAVVVFPFTSTKGCSGVLHQAGCYGKAVVLPDLGDLSVLVKEEGYRGEFYEPENARSLANSINKILQNDSYRINLGKVNYDAACSLPMSKITQMYIDYFEVIKMVKSKGFSLDIRNGYKKLLGQRV